VIAEATATHTYQRVKPYLFSVAYRMTGSASDAEDLVQDAWIRYLDAGAPDVDSMRAWLTTVISRLSLDYLKSARIQREEYVGPWMPEPVLTASALGNPEETIERREDVSIAFLVLLERLTPEQRVVYVLREALGLPYDEIAGHVGKTAAACRQISRRAQLRLTAERRPAIAPAGEHQRLAERFLAAVSIGNVAGVAELLTDDVVWEGDGGGTRLSGIRPVLGPDRVARGWIGITSKTARYMRASVRMADLNGAPAALVLNDGALDRVISFDVRDGRIAAIRTILSPAKLEHLARSIGIEVAVPFERSVLRSRRDQARHIAAV
jgi:RNA polymerase sigma-70 factor (ECF subfamily)